MRTLIDIYMNIVLVNTNFCLSVCRPSVCLSVCCLSFPSIRPSVHLSFRLSVCPPIRLFVNPTLTIASISIAVQSGPWPAGASEGADSIVAVMLAIIRSSCTLVNICNNPHDNSTRYVHCSVLLTTASSSICIEHVADIACTSVGPSEVDALVLAAMARSGTLIDVWIHDTREKCM